MSLTRFFRRSRWDEERARELEAHLAIEIDENIRRGMPADDARAAAQRKLGNTARIREDIYRFNSLGIVDTVWRDLRYAVRVLRTSPGFTTVAVLSLMLGVGANTAIFQVLNAVRLRSLPVAHPEQLVEIRLDNDRDNHERNGTFQGPRSMLTNALWERIRDRQQAFSSVLAWGGTSFELSAGGESREAAGLWVSGSFFTALDVRPLLGRVFTPADDRRGCAAPPAVISYAFWQREFGGPPSTVGQSLTLDGHRYEIVGVTPPSFFGVDVGRGFDVAAPLCAEPFSRAASSLLDRRDGWFLAALGRLKPGWTAEQATAHLRTLSAPMFRETLPVYRPEDAERYLAFTLGAFPARTGVSSIRGTYETPLWLLLAMTAVVLLVACANLANLMLARAAAREREIAVRLAIGASRPRIVGQLVTESLVIAVAGASAGAWLAGSLSRVLVASLTTENERVFVDVGSDWRVFAFVALLALATCILFGLVPAVRATAARPAAVLKAGSRGLTDSRERFGLRRVLVVAQVALTLVLMVAGLLFARSLRNLSTVDAGFTREPLLIASLDFRRTGAPQASLRADFVDLLDAVRRDPSVEETARVRVVPVSGDFSNRTIVVDGVAHKENVNLNTISDRYFATVQTPLVAGRDFDARDTAASRRVTIVTESFARVFFGGANPIGRTFQIEEAPDRPRPPIEIVGLVRDSKYGDLREAFEPLMYVPAAQDERPQSTLRLLVRSSAPLTAAASAVTAAARAMNPSIVVHFQTMASQVKDSLLRDRLIATLAGVFGALAVVIAMIGLYGVMSYSVARRRNEIGVRLALGAVRADVVRMVMREAGVLLGAGLVVGALSSMAAARFVRALLFGLSPHDPLTLTLAVAGLTTVAALASYIPAWRASRLEPTAALRDE